MLAALLTVLAFAVSFWFVLKEYPYLYGIVLPACILRRRAFKITVLLSMCVAAAAAALYAPEMTRAHDLSGSGFVSILIVIVASVLAVILLGYMKLPCSLALALAGAVEGHFLASQSFASSSLTIFALPAAGVVMTFVLSILTYLLLRFLIRVSGMHMLRLSLYMRYALIVSLVVLSASVAVNYAGFYSRILPSCGKICRVALLVLVVALPLLLLWRSAESRSNIVAEKCEEWNTRTILSAIIAIMTTYVLSDIFFPDAGVPIPPAPLMYASIFGVGIIRRRKLLSGDSIVRAIAGMLLAPAFSLFTAFFAVRISGHGNASGMEDLSVLLLAIAVMVLILSADYVSSQMSRKREMERIMASQQQEIYENSKALNEMELKTVLSENRLLHDTLELKRKEAMNIALSICEQKEYLESLDEILSRMSSASSDEERDSIVAEMKASIRQRLSFDQEIDSFYYYAQAEAVHKDFALRLSEAYPNLTAQEKRLATLLRLGFSSKYIATLMNITTKSVEIGRYRLRQKLNLSKGDNLVNFIKNI